MQRLRVLAYQTASQLKYCSPLGGLLVELRRSQALRGVGEKTIQKLEAIGAIRFPVIAKMTDELVLACLNPDRSESKNPNTDADADADTNPWNDHDWRYEHFAGHR
jgi:hypothetical protein